MVSQPSLQSMGELLQLEVDDPDDNLILQRVKELACAHLPEGWKEWKFAGLSKRDLLQGVMDPQILNKIRFALPTVSLARAFNPSASTLSEKRYREIKIKLLDWPFSIGLIVSPPAIATRIRGSAAHQEIVLAAIADLRPLMVSRSEACRQMQPSVSDAESVDTHSSVSKRRKESRLDALERSTAEIRNMLESFLERRDPIGRPLSTSDRVISSNDEEDCASSSSFRSNLDASSWRAPPLQPVVLDSWNFAPHTVEQEPSIAPPKPEIEAQGIQCQRLGSQSFNRIRYSEVQKKLQARPVFSALKVNSQIKHVGQDQEYLVRADTTLGTITHGLLLQREAFSETLRKLLTKHPSIAQEVQREFMDPQSDFRSLSDDLLQYTCGRRAEVIEQRRKAFKPQSDSASSLLEEIPPSATHLFEDGLLTELIKQHDHFFRSASRPIQQARRTSLPARDSRSQFPSRTAGNQRSSKFQSKREAYKSTSAGSSRKRGFPVDRDSSRGRYSDKKRQKKK